MRYRETNLEQIVITPRFNLRAGENRCPPDLRRSLADIGQITPLLVLEEDNHYLLVHGHRRLAGLMGMETKKTICAILDKNTPLAEILARLTAEYLLSGPMSPYNIAILLSLARRLNEKQRQALLDRVGINPRHHPAAAFAAIADLDPEARPAVDNGSIAAATALSLFKLAPEARDLVCRIITALKLSRQSQRELLAATMELAHRQHRDEPDIATEIWRYCRTCEGNPPQKSAALKRFLTEQLYPRSTAAREEFNAFVTALRLPPNATLSPAPAFESDRLDLSLTFKNRNEFNQFWNKISSGPTRR